MIWWKKPCVWITWEKLIVVEMVLPFKPELLQTMVCTGCVEGGLWWCECAAEQSAAYQQRTADPSWPASRLWCSCSSVLLFYRSEILNNLIWTFWKQKIDTKKIFAGLLSYIYFNFKLACGWSLYLTLSQLVGCWYHWDFNFCHGWTIKCLLMFPVGFLNRILAQLLIGNEYVKDTCEIDITNQLKQLKWCQLFCQISYQRRQKKINFK